MECVDFEKIEREEMEAKQKELDEKEAKIAELTKKNKAQATLNSILHRLYYLDCIT